MALPRTEVTSGLITELEKFEGLIRDLDGEQLATATRCEGWSVADVASHVIGTMADVTSGRLDDLTDPNHTTRQVTERQGRTASELADELAGTRKVAVDMLAMFDDASWGAPSPGGYDGSLGDGVEALWYDTYVHGQDIRTALGLPLERGDGLRAAVSHVAFELGKRGWGPATLALTGVPEMAVGDGSGRRIEADAYDFVLAATGRLAGSAVGVDDLINLYG